MTIPREKILVTGAGGMLGNYVDFGVRLSSSMLDVTDLARVREVCATHAPKAILHFAALTNLVECEKNPASTYHTNAVGAYNVALAARECGATLVYVSTSAVFDGKKAEPYGEEDVPNPQTHYGHAKYLGELAVASLSPDHIIARTCWMFGGGPAKDHKFVANILKQLSNPSIEVIGGKYGSPTYGKDFIAALLQLLDEGSRGLFHVGNQGAPTRVDIAREIVRITGAKTQVQEVDAGVFEAQYPGAGARGNESITSTKITLRPWQTALQEYIEKEWPTLAL